MPAMIPLRLDDSTDLKSIDHLAITQGLSRNAMLQRLIQAGLAYYRSEQIRLALEATVGAPISQRLFLVLTEDFGEAITGANWQDFVEFSKVMIEEEAK